MKMFFWVNQHRNLFSLIIWRTKKKIEGVCAKPPTQLGDAAATSLFVLKNTSMQRSGYFSLLSGQFLPELNRILVGVVRITEGVDFELKERVQRVVIDEIH